MQDKVIVGTGWYADSLGHNNMMASRELYKPNFFARWFRNVYAYFKPSGVICYTSNCPQPIEDIGNLLKRFPWPYFSFINSATPNKDLHHGHDGLAAIIAGATHAYLNGSHFVYVEQDCMVHNLDRMIKEQIAGQVMIGYGYGDNASFKEGWAEYSLLWVHNKFLKFFLTQMVNKAPHTIKIPLPEYLLHDIFKDYVTPFRNGQGRLRPIDFEQDWHYSQQLTDKELAEYEDLGKITCEMRGQEYWVI